MTPLPLLTAYPYEREIGDDVLELAPDDTPNVLLMLVNELLDDHSRLFNFTFPCGFKRPRLNDQAYSLDLRQRLIMAVKAAENGVNL
jgi:hypothetical protein